MDKPTGPNAMAEYYTTRIAEMEVERAALPRAERKPLNRRLHTMRQMVAWCKTRAGYVHTPEDLGLL